MQCHTPVQLTHYSREVETVSWSQDQRIAITNSDAVYILTLKGCGVPSSPTSLPAAITIAASPPCRENPPPTLTATMYDPLKDPLDFSLYLDPLLTPNHTPPLEYRESGWSPAGCDVIGGCLLSVLTASGHLWVLTPPGFQAMKWKMSTELSSQILHMQHAKPPAACTTFHWLPGIIPAEHGVGGVAVIAMATRSRCISVVAMEVPIYPNRTPNFHVLWEEDEVVGSEGDWPCRLRWSHAPSGSWCHLAVGVTSGEVVVLSWQLPAVWRERGVWRGGANGAVLPQPQRTVCWGERDGMAVRHITWQCSSPSPPQKPWLVFNKVSRLVAMQLQTPPTPNKVPSYITVCGVHSRAVSGLTCLPGNQYISCALDSSIQIFTLPNESHDGHVIPTPVTMETYPPLSGNAQRSSQGLAVSEHGLLVTVLTNMRTTQTVPNNRGKVCSSLHFSPLVPLSQLPLHNVSMSWDIREMIRMHMVTQQPLPSNVQSLLSSRQSSWQLMASASVQLCVQFHRKQLSECDRHSDGDGNKSYREDEISDSERGDMCAVLLMGHMCGMLVESEGREEEEGGDGRVALYLMSQWVGSSELATPTQQHRAKKMMSRLQSTVETETCPICQTSIPFTNYSRERCPNGHMWERCCNTLLLATSTLCSRCRGCGAMAHNLLSIQTRSGSWFQQQLASRKQCTFCNSFFELVT